MSRYIDADEPIKQIVHDAIDNTQMAEDVFVGIKEKLHKAVDEFNSDYIKREDAIKAMAQYLMDMALIDNPESSDRIEEWESNVVAPVMSTVKAADVRENVKGEWVEKKPMNFGKCVNGLGSIFKCSVCGEEILCCTMNYCPNCGADMRSEA